MLVHMDMIHVLDAKEFQLQYNDTSLIINTYTCMQGLELKGQDQF